MTGSSSFLRGSSGRSTRARTRVRARTRMMHTGARIQVSILPTPDRLPSKPPTPQLNNKRTKKIKTSRAMNTHPSRWVERLIDSSLTSISSGWWPGWNQGTVESSSARAECQRRGRSGQMGAGVQREWRCVVCWMDYQDLLRAYRTDPRSQFIAFVIHGSSLTLTVADSEATVFSSISGSPLASSSTPLGQTTQCSAILIRAVFLLR